ncbi:MAG: putative toxin-antitoxin system toxin component, PIN family [Verrucomicrobia bacterium]|jgi:uncharacterized protein|nr:putative toxin-antitoxin system toxin component, PIN family [Verrucomicrobiota bacterium]
MARRIEVSVVTDSRITAVLDTNVLISALVFGGQLSPLVDMMSEGQLRMFLSKQLLQELARVLSYPKISRVLARRRLTAENIIRAVVEQAAIVVAKPFDKIVITADPADDAVLACADTARAGWIVSGNSHLTDLGEFRGIPIVTPAQFLLMNPRSAR